MPACRAATKTTGCCKCHCPPAFASRPTAAAVAVAAAAARSLPHPVSRSPSLRCNQSVSLFSTTHSQCYRTREHCCIHCRITDHNISIALCVHDLYCCKTVTTNNLWECDCTSDDLFCVFCFFVERKKNRKTPSCSMLRFWLPVKSSRPLEQREEGI